MPFKVKRSGPHYRQTLALSSPTRGVRATEKGWMEMVLRGFALVLPALTVFSHGTAARIMGLPLPQKLEDDKPIHLTTDTAGKVGKRKDVVWHHRCLPTEDTDRWFGLPVTSPLRTWRDLGAYFEVEQLVIAADVLLRRELCNREEFKRTCGLRHADKLAAAAELARPGSASPEETRLRLEVLAQGLPEPTLNEDIIEGGIWIGRGDLVWRRWRVIADYDGEHHHAESQRHQDAQTRDDYTDAGWRHVPVTKKMTRADAVDRIGRALTSRGWTS